MVENKRMCQRSGTYEELTAAGNSLLQDEMLVVESGDPNTTTGRGLYMSYPNSQRERLRFASEELSADDIAEGSITNDLLHDDSVDTNNIIDGSITPAKFASSVGFGSGYSFICSNTGEIVAYSTGTSTITAFQPSGYTVPANYYVWLDKGVNSISSSALTRDSNHVLSRIYAENENVDLSGLDTTGVTVTRGFNKKYKQFILSSLSLNAKTVNSILSDIATLNAKFPIDTVDIKDEAVRANKIYNGAVTEDKIDTFLKSKINSKLTTVDFGSQSANAFDSLIDTETLFYVKVNGTQYVVWNIEDGADITQYRMSTDGIEWRKRESLVWDSWDYAIADNSVTYNALSIALQEIIDGKVDVSDIEDCMYYTAGTISSVSALNVNAYASEFIKYGLILTSSAATAFGVPSGTKAEMTVTAVGTVSSNNPAIRCITFPGISGLKWYQEVTSIGQTFTAGSWTRVNVRDEVVLKPNTTIGFDSNGCIAQIINVLGTTLGAGYGSNIRAIYINSSITTVSDDVFTTAPNLNSLCIDNVPGAVTFGNAIQTKIANREFNVIYRDSINLLRSLAISQKGTYERLLGLLPNYSIGFNSNGIVITRANVTDIGAGGIGNSNVRSIYVAPKVTSISSSIISATIGLTTDTLDLYVDNSQDNINIASEVLSDSRITIHYKDSFSVIDLLLNSQLQLNDRVTTLENTIGGLINGDEVSY